MTRGPKRKPTALHVVDGTYRADRHQAQSENEPMPEGRLEKPNYLKGRASKIWDRRAAALTWLTEVDSDAFATWCKLQALIETDFEDLPASMISQWRTLTSELGMVPAGRARIGASSGKKKTDPTEKYF